MFSTKDLLYGHVVDCKGIGMKPQRIEMPAEGKNILQFQNHYKQLQIPYIIYADFECLNIPVEGPACNPKESNTRLIANQVPHHFCYCVVRRDGVSAKSVLFRGENAVNIFIESLRDELKTIKENLSNIASIVMTPDDVNAFRMANDCHICGGGLGDDRVRDHCHITGKYRGATHNACNLKLRIYPDKIKVPVVFHNLRGYDSHLIMQTLGGCEEISCIPNNMERYMTFNVGQLQFIDSLQFQFLNSSLDKLSGNLRPDGLQITRVHSGGKNLELLRRKGVYPYEYINKRCVSL